MRVVTLINNQAEGGGRLLQPHPAGITQDYGLNFFVHGFDMALEQVALRGAVAKALRSAAEASGKRLIEVETNLRSFLNPHVGWGPLGHGPALATIGHLLSGVVEKMYIPASHTYTELFPWGSHPLLDPLWGSEAVEFVHDGAETTRPEKIRRIAESEAALGALRVCYKNPDDAYNCGQCEKCLRTMISLKAVGALERCPTFSAPLEPGAVRRVNLPSENSRTFAAQNLRMLEEEGTASDLQAALRAALRRSRRLALQTQLRTWAVTAAKKWIPGAQLLRDALVSRRTGGNSAH